MRIISLSQARLTRRPVVVTIAGRQFRITRPGLARSVAWLQGWWR